MKNFYFKKAMLSMALAVCAGVLLLAVNTAFSAFPSVNPPDSGAFPTFTGLGVTGAASVGTNFTVGGNATIATTATTNKLGVGTTSPQDKVHILYPGGWGNKGANASALRLESNGTGNTATNLEFVSTAPNAFDMGLMGNGVPAPAPAGGFYFNLRNNAPIVFLTNNTNSMSIRGNGNLIENKNFGVNGALGVVKDSIFGKNVFVTNNLIIGGSGAFLKDVAIDRDLSVGGGIVVEGSIMAGSNLIAGGNIQGNSNLDVTNNITAGQIGLFQRAVTDVSVPAGSGNSYGFATSPPGSGVVTQSCPAGFTVISCSVNIVGDPSPKIAYEAWPSSLSECYAKVMNYTTSIQTAQLVSICFNPRGTAGTGTHTVVTVGGGTTAVAKATGTVVGSGLSTVISAMDFSPITSTQHMDPANLGHYEFSIEPDFVPENFGFNGGTVTSFGSQFQFP